MKKFLPLILVGVGILVLGLVFFFVNKTKNIEEVDTSDESVVIDVAFVDRPFVALIPTNDGHYLKLKIANIVIPAKTLDYELLYQTKDDLTQGVPGSVNITGDSFEVDMLLGSESSGKFRYDEGVKTGSLSLRFRNDKGQLIARFTTDFHLQTDTKILATQDKSFVYELTKEASEFFVTMNTIGTINGPENVTDGPIGIFSSSGSLPSGSVNGSWQKLGDNVFYR